MLTDSSAALRRVPWGRGILPEGLVWNAEPAELSWVDIELGLLHAAAVHGADVHLRSVLELGDQLGCALPARGGGWICGVGNRLVRLSALGTVVDQTGPLLGSTERFNDGHVDPQGRLVIGTLNSVGPDGRQLLVRLERDGALTVLDDRVGLSNGIGWSPDGGLLYHADTSARTITRREYGDDCGHPEVLARIDGMPDGLAVDSEGSLWVTVFDQGRVDCFSAEGDLQPGRAIVVPSAHVASVAFGGARLDQMFIATGMPMMPGWLRARRREDGYVFARISPAVGLPTRPWEPAPLPTAIARRP